MPDVGSVMVIGLGRFGGAAARQLVDLGYEVVGVDEDADRVADFADEITKTIQSSCKGRRTLHQLGCTEVDAVLVAMGSDIEASVLITLDLVELGVERIWAKATSEAHQKILLKVGAHHVVLPEVEVGRSVAHRISDRVHDYFTIEEPDADEKGFVIAETIAPTTLRGRTLAAADVRRAHHVTIVCVKQPGRSWEFPTSDTKIYEGAVVLVAGAPADVERFSRGS